MNQINDLEIGTKLTNDQMMKVFHVGQSGGIRKSKTTKSICIIIRHHESLYEDRWDGDILFYTGQGKIGDQKLEKFNLGLYNAKKDGFKIYLLEGYQDNEYYYMGEMELIEDLSFENQLDGNGNWREVIIFPLKKRESSDRVILEQKVFERYSLQKRKKAKEIDEEKLIEMLKKVKPKKPTQRRVITINYDRDEKVKRFALLKAKGLCQLCNKPAPFLNKNENPYLEVHHIKWLSKGGFDNISNVVALCPNCHRKMHILNQKKDVKKLLEKARKLAE